MCRRCVGIMSQLCRHYVDITSTLCRYYVDIVSTCRHYVDIMSTLCRQYVDIMSTLCRHCVDIMWTLCRHYVDIQYVDIMSVVPRTSLCELFRRLQIQLLGRGELFTNCRYRCSPAGNYLTVTVQISPLQV